ncbi:2-succinyl-5-enolpyruvyl-6-hydroxy-3-cyclohexene-1-carboxylic-acid synthase [Alkalihalobacillus hwajinpoensis]|uniref:2-succinyl-5-enolpyruvyl-6-hydroxy-3- cyclohexene-1-carboxylic-acid synthase n=1 Tax=Guptibacillus hwajinpoensis TaxID=208199 RepID=UPI001883B398|nr:2-succinyl-5-enolpyruvyl-6-hydroxy-3-cyclohexene-1-carboxylic-acid synthase [Pseudalkalibacillus hwajinpoensis]MBF0706139.1 2-succinyl-5-enolpyruvyl-6-hydroxy-3-cyclohexene-1-carboxylic-acid synthase [Pseudalkalibacillus hwajinpoensis]
MTDQEILASYVGSFVDELVRSGVKHAVISPGSRSTPLAMVMAEHPLLNVWVHIDERSAGFFALGMAKSHKEPVALLCSSGTAGANYYPAVIEAAQSNVPLIVLTGDRPHELRDNGAPQAIDQIKLYGDYVKWFMEMAMPSSSPDLNRYIRTAASRATAVSSGLPAGPVHLNFPFRDPLIPDLSYTGLFSDGRENYEPWVNAADHIRVLNEDAVTDYANKLAGKKGIIVVGPQDNDELAEPLFALAEELGYPLLADPLSKCRHIDSPNLVEGYDAFLRGEVDSELYPEVVIRFGAMPVSKAYMLFMKRVASPIHIIVDERGWRDPTLYSSDMLTVSSVSFVNSLLPAVRSINSTEKRWLHKWKAINQTTLTLLHEDLGTDELFEGHVFRELGKLMSANDLLFVGNSMPIRDMENFFLPENSRPTVMGNRGANGIDGIISTALGASTAYSSSVLVIGDLSFYHDMNGLLLAKLYEINMTVIVVNNDGGGIFSFLPQRKQEKHFEKLFGTPHGLNYEHAAALYEASFERVWNWEEFSYAYEKSQDHHGLSIIEVPTDRDANLRLHREMFAKVSKETAIVLQESLKS